MFGDGIWRFAAGEHGKRDFAGQVNLTHASRIARAGFEHATNFVVATTQKCRDNSLQ
jgi:hypothetical protein